MLWASSRHCFKITRKSDGAVTECRPLHHKKRLDTAITRGDALSMEGVANSIADATRLAVAFLDGADVGSLKKKEASHNDQADDQ